MPTFIQQPDNSFAQSLSTLFNAPLQFRQGQQARQQAEAEQALKQQIAQSTIGRNNAAANLARQETGFNVDQQAAFNSPDLDAAIASLFTPDASGQVNPQNLGALMRFNPKNTLSNVGDLVQDVRSRNQSGQVAAQQDPTTRAGQVNLSALAANATLPKTHSSNANGIVTNQFTGAQSAPSAEVQNALLAQGKTGGSSKGNTGDLSQTLINQMLKSPVIDEFDGSVMKDLNTGAPIMRLDEKKIEQFSQFAALPETQGLSDAQLITAYQQQFGGQNQQQQAPQVSQPAPVDDGFLASIGSAFAGGGNQPAAAQPQHQSQPQAAPTPQQLSLIKKRSIELFKGGMAPELIFKELMDKGIDPNLLFPPESNQQGVQPTPQVAPQPQTEPDPRVNNLLSSTPSFILNPGELLPEGGFRNRLAGIPSREDQLRQAFSGSKNQLFAGGQ